MEQAKFDQDPDPEDPHGPRIGLASWIRIYTEVKSRIQIRNDTNADPQQWFFSNSVAYS
jgi:hypothetical protein